MFAYCNNCPIRLADIDGLFSIFADTYGVEQWVEYFWWLLGIDGPLPIGDILYITGIIVLGIQSVTHVYNQIVDYLTYAEILINDLLESTASIGEKKYAHGYEVHHIVAQNALGANEARKILEALYPDGYENEINKVTISTATHKRIHTWLYYSIVNAMVVSAYCLAGDDYEQQYKNVTSVLLELRVIILMVDVSTEQ